MNTLKSLFLLSAMVIGSQLFAGNTLSLNVKGMHCGGCEGKFKTTATGIKGIQEVSSVSAANGTAVIVYDEKVISAEKAIEELATQTGYTVSAVTEMGAVSSQGKPAACCKKGQSSAACTQKAEKTKCDKTAP